MIVLAFLAAFNAMFGVTALFLGDYVAGVLGVAVGVLLAVMLFFLREK